MREESSFATSMMYSLKDANSNRSSGKSTMGCLQGNHFLWAKYPVQSGSPGWDVWEDVRERIEGR